MLESFLADLEASLTASPIVKDIEILDEFITSVSGFLDCRVLLIDGSELYVSEYFTVLKDRIKRDKYSYHLQKRGELLIRWDNAPHHKEVSSYPHHKHIRNKIESSQETNLRTVLNFIKSFLG